MTAVTRSPAAAKLVAAVSRRLAPALILSTVDAVAAVSVETLWAIVFYWVLILLVLEVRTVHDYSTRRTFTVGAVMVFGVLALSAGIVLVGLLTTQEGAFLGEVGYAILRMFLR